MDYPPKVRMSDAAWLIKTLLTGCFSSLRGRNYSRNKASVNDFNKTNFFIAKPDAIRQTDSGRVLEPRLNDPLAMLDSGVTCS
jgi:hypothetical protein